MLFNLPILGIMSCQTHFQQKHKIKFGIRPVQRVPNGTIPTIQCLFNMSILDIMSRHILFQEKHKIKFGLNTVQRASNGPLRQFNACYACTSDVKSTRTHPLKDNAQRMCKCSSFLFILNVTKTICNRNTLMKGQNTYKLIYFNKKKATWIYAFFDM